MEKLCAYYDMAIKLQKKGFIEKCVGHHRYDKTFTTSFETSLFQIPAPLYDQVQDWLEKVHGLGIETALDETLSWIWRITPLHPQATYQQQIKSPHVYCNGRKEALVAAIEESLKHI